MLKNDIKFLGVGGSRKNAQGSTCVQVAENIVIDAGNIINGLGDEAYKIEHIFLTHSHLDHIVDIAFLVDNIYSRLEKPLKIYGLKETLEALDAHLFNDTIWPDFKNISLHNSSLKALEFIELEPYTEYKFEDVTLKPIPVSHTVATCAYVIKKQHFSTLFATDTYITRTMWETMDLDEHIDALIIDVSFPSRFEKLSYESKHLTPKFLKEELEKANRDFDVFITHIKPSFKKEVVEELKAYGLLEGRNRVLSDGEYLKHTEKNRDKNQSTMDISTALSKEKDLSKILEMILKEAIAYTNSEGGTIYLKEDNALLFKSLINKKLDIFVNNPDFPCVALYHEGQENGENISAICALQKRIVNIPNIYMYNMDGLSFDGVKKFDKANNYRTASMLVIPMINQDDEVVGVVQLINKKSEERYIKFEKDDIEMTSTYANWAATAITKNRLVEDLDALFLSFLESISVAMTAKSPFGHDHVARVAELMEVVSTKIDEDRGVFKDIHYSKEQLKELEVAAWMHDIGKIATPDYLLDKATKLEMVYDRIGEIKTRFDYVQSMLKSQMLEEKIRLLEKRKKSEIKELEREYEVATAVLTDDCDFLETINKQEQPLNEKALERIQNIAEKTYQVEGESLMLLSAEEVEYLSIKAGTFTKRERDKVNEHAKVSLEMMKMLTFPKKYASVTEIACAHHEKLNGTGHPLGLKADEISFEGRLMAVVDIFEALTANDRAYKTPKTIEQTFEILEGMVKRGELDGEIVTFLKESKAYEPYTKKHLLKEQYAESVEV